MKYSIIIPVYNAGEVVADCVNSIFQTGLCDFEIILVNDGSSDNSAEVCAKLCEKYPMVNYFYQENLGVSAARNNGIRHAKGKYILFCDADDFFEPDCFKGIDDVLTDNIDLLIYGMSLDYYHNNFCYRKDTLVYPHNGVQMIELWSASFEGMYNYNVLSPVWNKIYKREVIVENNLRFDTKKILLEDLMFSVTYLSYCNDIYFWDHVAYRYRQAEDERNAQRRLNKIASLNCMMCDIRRNFDTANSIIVKRTGCYLYGINKICYQIYYMLVSQKLYYSTFNQIKEISNEVLTSGYCDESMLAEIGMNNLVLYRNIKRKKIWKIRSYNIYCQLRHFFAVRYKSYMCKRGRKYDR